MCLVRAMEHHPNDSTIQISAAATLEVLVRLDVSRAPEITEIIALSGGIPVLFDAVKKFSRTLQGRYHDAADPVRQKDALPEEAWLTQHAVSLLFSMLRNYLGESRRWLLYYARDHPQWADPFIDLEDLELPLNTDAFDELVQATVLDTTSFFNEFALRLEYHGIPMS